MTEDKIRELFREMRDEPVPPDSRARVRMAVAERSQSWHEKLRRHWMIAAAVLGPAFIVVAMLVWRAATPAPVAPVVVRTMTPPAPEPVATVEVPTVLPAPVVRVRHRVVKQVQPAEAATLIRIETPDPDVVILLIGG